MLGERWQSWQEWVWYQATPSLPSGLKEAGLVKTAEKTPPTPHWEVIQSMNRELASEMMMAEVRGACPTARTAFTAWPNMGILRHVTPDKLLHTRTLTWSRGEEELTSSCALQWPSA